MGVKSVGEHYRCNICGNEVTVTRVGGGTRVLWGRNGTNKWMRGFKMLGAKGKPYVS